MSFSRKGPWKCARTLATQTGMTNKWLKDQGLLYVKEQWGGGDKNSPLPDCVPFLIY